MLGLSQERLGELLGVSYQQIQKYERGVNRIGSSRLHALSRILEVPVAYFFEDGMPAASIPSLPAGLEEGAAAFLFDAALAQSADAVAAEGREMQELVRAFRRIGDPQVRRRLLELARALAAAFDRDGAHGTADP
ncbi:helix-turn-helix domain-containing protein [Benzoatithermus flavus]